MRVLISVAASLMLTLALVGPVAATEPGPGCSDFAAALAVEAQAGGFGRIISSVNHGAFEPTFTGVGQLIQVEHRVGVFTYACAKYR